MSERAARITLVVLAFAGVALGVVAYQVQVDNTAPTSVRSWAGVIAWSFSSPASSRGAADRTTDSGP